MAFVINGNSIQDPTSWQSDGIAERDTFTDGAPLLQGKESGTLTWSAMSESDYADLYSGWNSNKGSLVSGSIPTESGSDLSSYRNVTAYFHQPTGEARGGLRFNVRMKVSFITG
jgi:hypothetical protein